MQRRQFLLGGSALMILAPFSPASAAQKAFRSISDGEITLPASIISPKADPAALREALTTAGLSATEMRNPLNVTALVRGEEVILFDCGGGPNFMTGAGKLQENLASAGLAPEKVSHVVFTHAHPDHLWGALDDFGSPAFANATYHIAAAEQEFWTSADVLSKLPEDRHAFAAGAQRNLKELASSLKTFRAGDEVLPGIAALDTAGHTPGHVSFEVREGSESLIVLGDALTHPIISFRHPDWHGGFDQDGERAVATRKKLLERLASEKLPIIGYHLPNGGRGRVERLGSAFRFIGEA